MKPASFKYVAPETLEEVLHHLGEHGYDAKLLAGGQSLIPAMNFRLAQPAVLIDLNRVSGLSDLRATRSELRIGAMVRHRTVETSAEVAQWDPLLAETMPHIAHVQIRNRGTFGGSIAHADPAAELPAVMVARNARFRAVSRSKERWIEAPDFFVGLLATSLEPDEVLVEVALDGYPSKTGWAFREVARRHGDYAMVGVAAMVRIGGLLTKCKEARLVFLSVGDGPVVAEKAAEVLVGEAPKEAAIREAAEVAASQDIDPPGDIHASPAFRRQLARRMAFDALTAAFERARGK